MTIAITIVTEKEQVFGLQSLPIEGEVYYALQFQGKEGNTVLVFMDRQQLEKFTRVLRDFCEKGKLPSPSPPMDGSN